MKRRSFRSACIPALILAALAAGPAVGQQRPASGDSTALPLADAVGRALMTHPSLARAEAERASAASLADAARATRLPSVGTEWSAVRFQEPMVVQPIHGFTQDALPDFDRTLVQGSVGATWLLFDGGARGARIARADAATSAAEAGVAVARTTLLAMLARAYLGVLSARETLAAHESRLRALAAERSRAQRLFDEGRAARVAILRADAASSRAEADRVAAEGALRLREADLARLIGAAPAEVEAAALDSLALADPPTAEAPADLRARAVASDPAVLRARRAAETARASIGEARGAYLPALSLTGRYNEYGSGEGDFSGEWQGGVQLSYALFTGGARGDVVDRARADARAAEALVRITELEAAASVDRAWTAVAEARARADALAAAVVQFEEVADVERLAVDAGAGVQTDYLRAESDLLEARAALTAARHTAMAAAVELARATGQLTPAWLTANLEVER
jgi:outer membrane protein TolC